MSTENIQVVQSLYAAFFRRDMPAMRADLAIGWTP